MSPKGGHKSAERQSGRKGIMIMTKTQERKIELLKKRAAQELFMGDDDEFKKFEVTELNYGGVSVIIETGTKGDEGTLAQVFCRYRVHVFVGKRGGLTYYNARGTSKSGKGKGLFSIYYEQKHIN